MREDPGIATLLSLCISHKPILLILNQPPKRKGLWGYWPQKLITMVNTNLAG